MDKRQKADNNGKPKKIFKTSNSEEPEHNTGADRYLITYADLITLLLGLFVILYATSQVDKSKFEQFSKAFSSYFKPEKGVLDGSKGITAGGTGAMPEPVFQNNNQPQTMQQLSEQINESLKNFIKQGLLEVKSSNESITLILPEVLLFNSGKANVLTNSLPVLDSIAKDLSNVNYEISIDGHTDAIPIKTFQYASNWHLSVDRALNIGYYLIQQGLPEKNVVIRGYGSERPVDDNSTEQGRMRNRRVEITIKQNSANAPTSTSELKLDSNRKKLSF